MINATGRQDMDKFNLCLITPSRMIYSFDLKEEINCNPTVLKINKYK